MRRRGFGGSMRPFRRGMRAVDQVPPALQRADALFAAGNYPAAAEDFERLARGAEADFPARAPHLWLRAGQVRLHAGHTALGMDDIKRGLSLLLAAGQVRIFQRAGQRAVTELSERGFTAEAQQIAAMLTAAGAPVGIPPSASLTRPVLPASCPACGGPVRPDEIEWLDEITAECAYCGSPLRQA